MIISFLATTSRLAILITLNTLYIFVFFFIENTNSFSSHNIVYYYQSIATTSFTKGICNSFKTLKSHSRDQNNVTDNHGDKKDNYELNYQHDPDLNRSWMMDLSSNSTTNKSRRTILSSSFLIAANRYIFFTPPSQAATSVATTTITTNTTNSKKKPNLKCLLDLPPIPPNHVRIYLCRHGQTENNRLHLVQGARVDPPINEMGEEMAIRIGKSFYCLQQQQHQESAIVPQIGVHSQLKRAEQTAKIASYTYSSLLDSKLVVDSSSSNQDMNGLTEEDLLSFATTNTTSIRKSLDSIRMGQGTASDTSIMDPSSFVENKIPLETLSTLGEVDFGPNNEGAPAIKVRADMMLTYSAWSQGRIDISPTTTPPTTTNGLINSSSSCTTVCGESGRSVLHRAATTLHSLVQIAKQNNKDIIPIPSILLVSHSTFIRILLAIMMDIPLAEAGMLQIMNGCINVVDIHMEEMRTIGPKSNIFGGRLSLAPSDFELVVPTTNVLRVNEIRHIKDLV